jgi:hypothetical protein
MLTMKMIMINNKILNNNKKKMPNRQQLNIHNLK